MLDVGALRASLEVIRVLEDLDVPYLVGGSLASSFHGTPRSTNDVDLVADLRLAHVPLLAAALEADFYLDRDRIRSAVRSRSSFNIIFLETMFKAASSTRCGSRRSIDGEATPGRSYTGSRIEDKNFITPIERDPDYDPARQTRPLSVVHIFCHLHGDLQPAYWRGGCDATDSVFSA